MDPAVTLVQRLPAELFAALINLLAGLQNRFLVVSKSCLRFFSLLPGLRQRPACGFRARIQRSGKGIKEQAIEKRHEKKDEDYRRDGLDKKLSKLARDFTHKRRSYRLESLGLQKI